MLIRQITNEKWNREQQNHIIWIFLFYIVTNCWLLFLYFITEPHLRKLFSIDLQNRFPFIQKIFERLVKNIPFSHGNVYFPLREMIMCIFELTFATNWEDCPLFKAIGGGFESSWDSECSPTAFQQWAMGPLSSEIFAERPKSSQKCRSSQFSRI